LYLPLKVEATEAGEGAEVGGIDAVWCEGEDAAALGISISSLAPAAAIASIGAFTALTPGTKDLTNFESATGAIDGRVGKGGRLRLRLKRKGTAAMVLTVSSIAAAVVGPAGGAPCENCGCGIKGTRETDGTAGTGCDAVVGAAGAVPSLRRSPALADERDEEPIGNTDRSGSAGGPDEWYAPPSKSESVCSPSPVLIGSSASDES